MPRDALFAKLRRAVERLNTRQLRETIREFSPDHVICTHFLPAELLAHEIRRKRIGVPIWVQVTDFDLHRLWVQPGMRGYFAASEEIAFRMAARGIAAENIFVTGIPIMPAFTRRLDRAECARELGIDPNKTTLLVMTGGAGLTGGAAMIERLTAPPGDLLSFEVLGAFDVRPRDQFVGDEIQAAGDDRHIGADQIGVHCERAGGKKNCDWFGDKRLHADRAAFDGDVLQIDAVLFHQLELVGRPEERMNDRKPAARGADRLGVDQ